MNLSNITHDIKYIQLETEKDNLIGKIHKVHFTENYIYVMAFMGESIFCFNQDGIFVSRISREGKGPGEYYNILAINGPIGSDNIFLIDELKKLIEFKPNGEHVRTLNYKYGAFDVAFLDKTPVLYIPGRSANPKNYPVCVAINVKKGKSDILLNRPDEIKNRVQVIGPHSINFGDYGIKLWEQYNDTVLNITGEEVIPSYAFIPSDNGIPEEVFRDPMKWEEAWQTHDVISKVMETENHIFINARSGGQSRRIVFSKKSMAGFSLINEINNDLDSGFDFWPDGIALKGTKMYQFKDAFELCKIRDKIKEKGEWVDLPDDNFKKLLNSVDENDNPVLILISLKK